MPNFSSQAILLRKIEFGDYDYIITFLTKDRGKIVAIAKNAKKSIKRFFGKLELFSILQIVLVQSKGKALPILKEASLEFPFEAIRIDYIKTTYASYWSEILIAGLENGRKQEILYTLLFFLLGAIDLGKISSDELNITFLIKFMKISGFLPNLQGCIKCHKIVDRIDQKKVFFDFSKGGLVCTDCSDKSHIDKSHIDKSHIDKSHRGIYLSKGTIKHLLWINSTDSNIAVRVKFAQYAIYESELFLESFLPFLLGREVKSLKVLQRIRNEL